MATDDDYRPWWKRTLFTIGLQHMAHRPPLPRRWAIYCALAYLVPVVMIEVLHEIAPHLRPHVLGACSRALDAGGWLLIVDETYPTTLAQARVPEFRFPLQTGVEELLWGNVLPTREEQESLLHDAGFSGGIRRELIGEGFTVLAARKPQIR